MPELENLVDKEIASADHDRIFAEALAPFQSALYWDIFFILRAVR